MKTNVINEHRTVLVEHLTKRAAVTSESLSPAVTAAPAPKAKSAAKAPKRRRKQHG